MSRPPSLSPEGFAVTIRGARVRALHACGLWLLETDGQEWAFCANDGGRAPEVLARAPAPLRNLRQALRERGLRLALATEDALDAEAFRLRVFHATPPRKR